MKKALKIIGITLGSIVVLALVLVGVGVYMLTSSGRLTQMVKKYAPQFISCDLALDKAQLTLFKTFPNVGVDIEHVALINPMIGSPSDTLASIDNLVLVVDANKFRKEKEIVVKRCILENAFVNIYTDSLGQNNFNVFSNKDDDSTRSAFDYLVDIEEVKLKNVSVFYADDRSQLKVRGEGLNMDVNGKMQGKDILADLGLKVQNFDLQTKGIQLSTNVLEVGFDGDVTNFDQINGKLKIGTPDITLNLNEPCLENDTLLLDLPLQFSISNLSAHLEKAQIGLNRYRIDVDGNAGIAKNKDVNLDLVLSTNTLVAEDVLTYLPTSTRQKLNGIEYQGKLRIVEAAVTGTYNDSLMPLISAKVTTDNAQVNVQSMPYPFTKINLDADLFLDLNNKEGSATINNLETVFNHSNLNVNGVVSHLFGDMALQLQTSGDVPMTDLKRFMPENIHLGGRSTVNLSMDFTLDQLKKSLKDYNFNRLKANGTLAVRNFALEMDTIQAIAPKLNLTLALPASSKMKGQKGIYVALTSERLETQVGTAISVKTKNPDIKLVVDKIKEGVGKMNLRADLKFGHLDAFYDNVVAHADVPVISVVTKPEKNGKGLKADISYNGKAMNATIGDDYELNTNTLRLDASVDQNKAKEDFLNRWNPSAEFGLNNAVLKVDGLDEDIRISNIDFLYDSRKLDLKNSTFVVGKSDLSLQGNLVGIKEWKEDHKNLLKGEFLLSSDMLDINEIMDLTSGWGADADSEKEEDENIEDNPFMVPQGVDISFSIKTKRAVVDNFDLNHLGGGMTVKDGTLILQEIGFTNKAAEMQLTAMYKSPKRSDLFLAMDFHLLDVQINDLLHMIPYIDTLVPMLKTFDGQAEFHIGAQTNLKANYEPQISTFMAAADIEGKNLSVNDKFAFTKITDMLNISTNGEYRVDSLDVQLTARKNTITLWPSQIGIGKYKVTVNGRMTHDKNGAYHLSVTESPLPVRFGLSVSGPLNNLEYKLEKPLYPTLYKPDRCTEREQMCLKLKKMIADRLKENVK